MSLDQAILIRAGVTGGTETGARNSDEEKRVFGRIRLEGRSELLRALGDPLCHRCHVRGSSFMSIDFSRTRERRGCAPPN